MIFVVKNDPVVDDNLSYTSIPTEATAPAATEEKPNFQKCKIVTPAEKNDKFWRHSRRVVTLFPDAIRIKQNMANR